jgi:transmembrane sensor
MTPTPFDILTTTQDVAADWFALRRSGAMTQAQLREFQVWLERDPAHRAAFDDLERMWDIAAAARTDPEMLAIREAELRAYPPRPGRRTMAALAACLVVALAAAGGWAAYEFGLAPGWGPHGQVAEQLYRTGVGQRATVNLADGSVVTLDTDTVLRTRESGRRRLVYLERGRAFFRVAKDSSRPFVVTAAGKTVTAVGTTFEVRLDPGALQVTLVEGRVRVAAKGGQFSRAQSADMVVGWRLVARDGQAWEATQVDLNKETSWLSGRLTFLYDPLEDVVAELNRYSDRKIVLGDRALARKPIVGVVEAGDLDGFIKLVRAYRLAKVSVRDDAVVLTAP